LYFFSIITAGMNVIPLGTARGECEVHVLRERIESGGYGPFKYTVTIPNERRTRDDPQLSELHCTCDCQKPQLTGISCSHVFVVCQHKNFDVYGFIHERYNTAHILNTWSDHFHCYGDQQVWPPYLGETIIPNKKLIKIGRCAKVRRRMVMDEIEGRIRSQGRSRNIQSSQGVPSRRYKINRDQLSMNTLQSGWHRSKLSSPTTNRRIQTSRDALQSARHSTSYDLRDNNRRTLTSRDALQSARLSTSHDPRDNNIRTQISRYALLSARFSTGHDSRDNNRSTESRQNQEKQAVNASTSSARGNNFGGGILNFFAGRKKINVTCIYGENV
jgi:SWIM zinc finger